jgi:hypothetical protein
MLLLTQRQRQRRAAAVVELAVMVPFLAFLFVATTDFCRVFYFSQVVTTCARNAALYVGDPDSPIQWPYANVTAAAGADADPTVASKLTVTSASGTDAVGKYTRVTVSYPFVTLTNYPGLPKTTTITRTALVRPAPATPK